MDVVGWILTANNCLTVWFLWYYLLNVQWLNIRSQETDAERRLAVTDLQLIQKMWARGKNIKNSQFSLSNSSVRIKDTSIENVFF